MKTPKNSPQVWDSVWEDPGLSTSDVQLLATERASVRWQRIQAVIRRELGDISGLSVLELGSGIGTYAALLAELGAHVTLLDYSPKALERAKIFFRNNSLSATFILGDALRISPDLYKRPFDVSISVGVNEHFSGKKRMLINKNHLVVLRQGGLACICVPNAYNLPYRIFKLFSEWLGVWQFGEEYPYTRAELKKICRQIGGTFVTIIGEETYNSIRFLLPANFLRRWFGVDHPQREGKIRPQRGFWFDQYLAYSLTLVMKKP